MGRPFGSHLATAEEPTAFSGLRERFTVEIWSDILSAVKGFVLGVFSPVDSRRCFHSLADILGETFRRRDKWSLKSVAKTSVNKVTFVADTS